MDLELVKGISKTPGLKVQISDYVSKKGYQVSYEGVIEESMHSEYMQITNTKTKGTLHVPWAAITTGHRPTKVKVLGMIKPN